MTQRVCLPIDVRVFTRMDKTCLLGQTGLHLPCGAVVIITNPQTMVYDHRDQVAVSFEHEGDEYWMLVNEMNIPELIQ